MRHWCKDNYVLEIQTTQLKKLYTHSLLSLSDYFKNIRLSNYESHCLIPDCFVCNHNP